MQRIMEGDVDWDSTLAWKAGAAQVAGVQFLRLPPSLVTTRPES